MKHVVETVSHEVNFPKYIVGDHFYRVGFKQIQQKNTNEILHERISGCECPYPTKGGSLDPPSTQNPTNFQAFREKGQTNRYIRGILEI
ncbi:MAG: hypothetical protein CL920_33135 [Deltaproteobacteria bacterium]|nr:hypothetical protein [Deltaproteobacteria bacterium]